MKTALVIGAGGRGTKYSEIAASLENGFKIVAVAEPIKARRDYMMEKFSIPREMCHESWEELLEKPKFADVAIICTMDRDHFAPAMAAIEKGYDLLLEKPMSATPEECCEIERAAARKGVFVLVCHVLRFTAFFRTLKRIIDSGDIGKVMHIQHAEWVGNLHQSHSFVRGNWRNSDESSPMILQKSCHDMDILAWLMGKRCTRVHSFGSLSYFIPENAPDGSPEYCVDGCPHKDSCYYYAPKLYHETYRNSSFVKAVTKVPHPTDEDIELALRTTDYGKCVFKCNNNVVDHQTVNLEFEDGATVSFSMCAFNKGARNIRIMGTDGEIIGNMSDDFVTVYSFATRKYTTVKVTDNLTDEGIDGGHGGGDEGIIRALAKRLDGYTGDSSICTIDETCRNHLIAFAAEESRISGTVVDMKEFENRFGGLL